MSDKQYKIAVVGGGAVGLTFAAQLAGTAHVLVKTRSPKQAAILKAQGICLVYHDGNKKDFTGIDASPDPAALADCDAIIITVKSYDTEVVAKEIANFLKPDAEVLSLQNGLQAFDVLRTVLPNPQRVFAGVTYIGGTRLDERTVKLGNNRKVLVDSKAVKLVGALSHGEYPVEPSNNIQQAVWDKLVLNVAQNALSAVTNLNLGQMLASAECLDIAEHLLNELEQVAKAEGITFDYSLLDALKDNWQMSSFYPSMWQDLHNGNRTEIDAINGAIGKLGKQYNVATPYNDMITALVKVMESSNA